MRIPFFHIFRKNNKAPLIIHFCHHKGMTVYFFRVFNDLAAKFGWHFKYYNWHELDQFTKDIHHMKKGGIFMNGDRMCDIKLLPDDYVGSHLVRDPRDLLISGYNYHKWTKESWAREPLKKGMMYNLGLKKLNLDFDYSTFSYQQVLNAVDQNTGLEIELNWRKNNFNRMFTWDYQNPSFMELKYEHVFGNEEDTFAILFRHYGFNDEMIHSGLKYVQRYSFKNQKKSGVTGDKQHLAKGVSGQWKEFFSPEFKKVFKERHQALLEKLDYEQDDTW